MAACVAAMGSTVPVGGAAFNFGRLRSFLADAGAEDDRLVREGLIDDLGGGHLPLRVVDGCQKFTSSSGWRARRKRNQSMSVVPTQPRTLGRYRACCRVSGLALRQGGGTPLCRYTPRMAITQQVLTEALRLQPGDRADLAAALLASLDEQEDAGAAAAWDDLARRRALEIDSGQASPISSDEFFRRLRDDR